MSKVVAAYLVKVVVRAEDGVSGPTIKEIELAIEESVRASLENDSVEVNATAERTDT